jgi:predicted transcriptional regulator
MGKGLQDVQQVFTSLLEQINKLGLEINGKKTKICDSIAKPLQWKLMCKDCYT